MSCVRTLCCFLLLPTIQVAEARVGTSSVYQAPGGYYAAAGDLIGTDLKAALHERIRGHRVLSYGSDGTVPALRVLDAMPDDPTQVRLLYWGTGRSAANYGGGNGQWNHEHCWPRSYGIGSSGPGNADLFNLRPCDVAVNSERANFYFAEIDGGTPAVRAPLCRKTSSQWMPRPEEKGDLARAMFYMAVRYEGGEATADLELSDTPDASANRFGHLSDLLRWHREDPVDEEERRRNHLIYTDYQFNRNPFVDDPDYAEMVFRGVPVVRVTAVQAVATEGLDEAVVRISRRGPVAQSLTVPLVYDGTADPGQWEETPSVVTIPAGAAAVDLVLAARSQPGEQGLRTLRVAAADSGSYAPVDGPAELALRDAPDKVVPELVIWPVAGPAIDGMTLAEIALTGGEASVPGTFAFAAGQIVPPVGLSSQQVLFTPTDTTAYESLTLVVEVRVDPPPAAGFAHWLQGGGASPEALLSYAIGGASSPTATDGVAPTSEVTLSNLSITAIVRTNDPNLSVVGQAVTDLTTGPWTTNNVTMQPGDQTGVGEGLQRQIWSTPRNTDSMKFLRLQTTLSNQ